MVSFAVGRRMGVAQPLTVTDPGDKDESLSKRLGDVAFYLIGVGTVALIATCIRVWAGMDVIQTQINGLVKSDNQQDQEIRVVQDQINTMRVQIGIMRVQLGTGPHGLGRP